MSNEKFGLHSGALAPPIKEQLSEQGLEGPPEDIKHFQKDLDAINRLRLRSLIPDSQAHRAFDRLVKNVGEKIYRKTK